MIGLTTINGFHLPTDKRFEKIKEAGIDSIYYGGEKMRMKVDNNALSLPVNTI